MKNINTEDNFTYAIRNKDLEHVEFFVNSSIGYINTKNAFGRTPLHIAAETENNSDIINI